MATTVASNGNAYGIQYSVCSDPLKKHLPLPEKVTMIKNQRITPSVSTKTVSQPMKMLSDTLSGFRPAGCCDNYCMMSYDNQLLYWNLPSEVRVRPFNSTHPFLSLTFCLGQG